MKNMLLLYSITFPDSTMHCWLLWYVFTFSLCVLFVQASTMIESVQVRHRGAYDYETHYDNLCALQDSCPLPAVKAHLSQGVLDLNGDRIR